MPLLLVTTAYAYGNYVSVLPQPVAPGQTLTVVTDTWETTAPLAFYWNGNGAAPIANSTSSAAGTDTVTFAVPPSANGSYDLAACEGPASSPSSSCFTTLSHYSVQVATPATPPPVTPKPTPKAVHRTPRPTPVTTPTPTAAPTPTAPPTPAPTPAADGPPVDCHATAGRRRAACAIHQPRRAGPV